MKKAGTQEENCDIAQPMKYVVPVSPPEWLVGQAKRTYCDTSLGNGLYGHFSSLSRGFQYWNPLEREELLIPVYSQRGGRCPPYD